MGANVRFLYSTVLALPDQRGLAVRINSIHIGTFFQIERD